MSAILIFLYLAYSETSPSGLILSSNFLFSYSSLAISGFLSAISAFKMSVELQISDSSFSYTGLRGPTGDKWLGDFVEMWLWLKLQCWLLGF